MATVWRIHGTLVLWMHQMQSWIKYFFSNSCPGVTFAKFGFLIENTARYLEQYLFCVSTQHSPLYLSIMLNWSIEGNLTIYTEYTQKNGAVSKVNKKFISHLIRAQRTPSAAATVQVSHALPAVRFSCLLRGRRASFQDGVAAGKVFLCASFWGVQICDYSAAWVSCSTV